MTEPTLRPWQDADAPALAAAWSDPRIQATTAVPTERSLVDAQRWIAGSSHRWDALISRDLVVVDEWGRVVGEVGLHGFAAGGQKAQIGWWVAAHSRGRGFAKAAVGRVVQLAFAEWHVRLIAAVCASTNHASHRVAVAAGFTHEATNAAGELVFARRRDGSGKSA